MPPTPKNQKQLTIKLLSIIPLLPALFRYFAKGLRTIIMTIMPLIPPMLLTMMIDRQTQKIPILIEKTQPILQKRL